MRRLLYILLVGCVFSLTCTHQQPCGKSPATRGSVIIKAWQQAQQQNSIEAYRTFLQKYSCNDSLVQLAHKKIDSLKQEQAWQSVKNTNSIDSLRAFCLMYPYSPHHTEAYNLANKILHSELDTRYRVVPEFFAKMSQAQDPYSVFRQYATRDFCIIKTRRYEEHEPVSDTFPVPSRAAFDSLLNTNIFKVCNQLFMQGELLRDYELQCDSVSLTVLFHLSCGDISFRWLTGHTMKLRCMQICQDLRL